MAVGATGNGNFEARGPKARALELMAAKRISTG
jgi:hypothetical protein